MRTTHIKFIFVAVYRPSSLYVTELFFDEFAGLFEVVSAYHTSIIISGDLNIPADDADDALAPRFLDIIDALGFTQYVTGLKHVRGHTLDHIITQPSCASHDIVVNPPIFSDHHLISCKFIMVRPTPRAQQFKVVRRLNSIDSDSLVDAIRRSVIVDNIVHLVDYTVADLCRLYHSELRKLLDEIAPSIFTLNRHKSPWFDGECSAIRRQAWALKWRYRQSRLPADLVAWSASLEEKRTLFNQGENILVSQAGELLWQL